MNGLEINEKPALTCYSAEDWQKLALIAHQIITASVDAYKSLRRIAMQRQQADASVCSLAKSFFRSPISFERKESFQKAEKEWHRVEAMKEERKSCCGD
jgi:hypothetical protein